VHTIDSEQDAEDYIARLNNLPDYFDGVIEQIQIRMDKGLYLVDWMIPQIVASAGNVLVGAPFDQSGSPSVIWADFNDKLAALKVEPAIAEQLREAAREAMLTAVKPAYERLIAAVQSQQTVAPKEDGVWRFPDGDAFYANRLRDFTTTNLTPEAIHQAGLANVERLHREMRSVMAELGEEGELSAFLDQVRNDESLRYDNTEAGTVGISRRCPHRDRQDGGAAARLFWFAAAIGLDRQTGRSLPRTVCGKSVLPEPPSRWLSSGHLLRQPLRHELHADY
jgi:uncharacterized protein (DUF885 family)